MRAQMPAQWTHTTDAAPPTHIVALAITKLIFNAAKASLLALNHSLYLTETHVQFHDVVDAQNMPPPVVVLVA